MTNVVVLPVVRVERNDDPMDDSIEGWLDIQITDAENVVGMYRSYRQTDSSDYLSALARLHALEDVRKKLEDLWDLPPRGS